MSVLVELHLPVMKKEVVELLITERGGVYLDATLGDGGHAEAICKALDVSGKLIGLDWDAEALKRARERLSPYEGRVCLYHDSYTRLTQILDQAGHDKVDGVLIDLGASTLQLMDAGRGFSLHREGDLDMRMDRRCSLTARQIVNSYSFQDLADIFFRLGEERWSKRIAAAIVRYRENVGLLSDSKELAEIVKNAVPARYRRQGRHPARKSFQALRLAVNSELANIGEVLPQAAACLKKGGRVAVIAYHSLEDRIVKRFFREEARGCLCPAQLPCICSNTARLKPVTSGAVRPEAREIENNPRARSAILRVAEKLVVD